MIPDDEEKRDLDPDSVNHRRVRGDPADGVHYRAPAVLTSVEFTERDVLVDVDFVIGIHRRQGAVTALAAGFPFTHDTVPLTEPPLTLKPARRLRNGQKRWQQDHERGG